jgi:Fe-S-cluster containining protein
MPPKGFTCTQCGHCCLNLGAYQSCATVEDVDMWEEHGRDDILEWVEEIGPGIFDIWISPRTHDDVNRCPWLRKLPGKDKYICRIQDMKPEICRNYPHSRKHAQESGCPGLGRDAGGG